MIEDLPATTLTVMLDPGGGAACRELGTVDLQQSDGTLSLRMSSPRQVRAQVFVDGVPGLPGELRLSSAGARVEVTSEDPDRGILDFSLWPFEPGLACGVSLWGTRDHTTASAMLPAATGPARIELHLRTRGARVLQLDISPPLAAGSDVLLERARGASTWDFVRQLRRIEPQILQHQDPGRYRLHDRLSGTIGSEAVLAGDGSDALLTLDLSRVVVLSGVVVTTSPASGVAVELRDAQGRQLLRRPVAADNTFGVNANLDRQGLQLVAVRGDVSSPPVPVTGAMAGLQLLLPD